ncbi:signal peptidase II [Tunturibacter empetritectus]|uniref:Lipoprotein signal peptidase n=1 Tax=Tunturiibacter empetritectus TaxID=3069691 RepID=A0A7W8IET9_9BACT|nr:signal peptidase II [Edaphobacter lichenicola]MBB5315894.1 signal peptidase II [Edaphobacter lichenicola]
MSSLNKTTYETTAPAVEPVHRDQRGLTLAIAAAVVLLDRITKHIVARQLPNGQAHTVIPGIFRITDVHNTGAAFSMFAESASPTTVRNILIAFSVLAVIVLLGMLWRAGRVLSLSSIALALILGGAFGNLYDRVRYSYVVDFLEVHIGSYHWPDFNVADSCIVIGACLLLIEIFRPQPSDS